jgi:hypothetical protein
VGHRQFFCFFIQATSQRAGETGDNHRVSQQVAGYLYLSGEDQMACYEWAVRESGVDPLNHVKKDNAVEFFRHNIKTEKLAIMAATVPMADLP